MEPVIIPSSSDESASDSPVVLPPPKVKAQPEVKAPVLVVESDQSGSGTASDSDVVESKGSASVHSSSETESPPPSPTKQKSAPPKRRRASVSSSSEDEAPDALTRCKELIICQDGYKGMPKLTDKEMLELFAWSFDPGSEWGKPKSFLRMSHVMMNFENVASDAMKEAAFKCEIGGSSAKKRRKKGTPSASKRTGNFWIKTLITRVKKRKATFKITPNLTKWDVEPLNKGSEQEWDSQNPSLLSPALQSIINTLASTFNKKDQMPGLAEGIVRKKSYTRLSDVTRPAFRRAVRKVHTERYVTVTAKNTAQEATFHLMKTVYGGIHHYKFWVFV